MEKPLIIKNPQVGIGPSPHLGYHDMRNIDINSIPGVARLNNSLVKVSSTTVVTLPQWFVRNPATPAEVYALDSAGKVYRSADSGASWTLMTGFTAGGHGNGLAIFKNYLIVARDAYLDICGDGAASGNGTTTGIANGNWTNSWQAIDSDALWHPMIVSKNDGILYGGASNYLFSLEEEAGQTFAPGTGATFTYTQQALDLPSRYRVKCLDELGNNIMAGTWQGSTTPSRIAEIFPWAPGSTSFGQPITMDEHGVHAIKNINQTLYILAGTEGRIYSSQGLIVNLIGQIPKSIVNTDVSIALTYFPGAVANYKGRFTFGLGSASAIDGMGVWSLNQTSKGNILNLEHGISTENWGALKSLQIGALLPIAQDTILVGWKDDTTYGIDLTDNDAYNYTSTYTGYIISPFYNVGSNLKKRQYTELEFQLARLLRANEGIKIGYRTDLTSDFTEIGTYIYSGTVTATTEIIGAVLSHNTTASIPNTEFVEVKISMTGTTTRPEWRSLTLK